MGPNPQTLVGHRIKWYYNSSELINMLTFRFTEGRAQFVAPEGFNAWKEGNYYRYDSDEYYSRSRVTFEMDGALNRGSPSGI